MRRHSPSTDVATNCLQLSRAAPEVLASSNARGIPHAAPMSSPDFLSQLDKIAARSRAESLHHDNHGAARIAGLSAIDIWLSTRRV